MLVTLEKLVALNRKGDVAIGDSDPNSPLWNVHPDPVQPVGKGPNVPDPSGPADTGTGRTESVSPLALLSGVNW